MIADQLTRPCILRTRTTSSSFDAFGDPDVTVTDVETTCELQQVTTSELRDGRLVAVSSWDVYLPAGSVLDTSSEVLVDGDTYTLDGDPWPARDPLTRQVSHIEARVRRVR